MKATTSKARRGRRRLTWVGLLLLAGCTKGAYEAQLQATVDQLRVKQIEQIQDNIKNPGGAPAAAAPAGQPGANPGGVTPAAANEAAAKGAAATGGLSPVGQSIVAPLE